MYHTIKKIFVLTFLASYAVLVMRVIPAYAVVDSFKETFDSMQDGATVDKANAWSVTAGSPSNAISKAGVSSSGSGKALKIANSLTPVSVSRPALYGGLSPTWVAFDVKPGLGSQASPVPTGRIAAVCFNYSGEILVSDGSTWVKTGQTFDPDQWVHVLLKLNFTNHLYSTYISPTGVIKTPFVPDKQNLHFIDSTINSVSRVGFDGVYNANKSGDTYVDEMTVNFIDRLAIVAPSQNIPLGQPSAPITVQLQNASNESQTAWKDTTIELRSSTSTGDFSINKEPWSSISQVIIPEGGKQAIVYYKDTAQGKPIVTFKEYPDLGWQEASQQLSVVGQNQSFEVTAFSPQIAGRPFVVQVTAKDESGNANKIFTGSVDIAALYDSPAFGGKAISPDSGTGFVGGVGQKAWPRMVQASVSVVFASQ